MGGVSQFIHCAFKRVDADGGARGAHVQRGVKVQRHQLIIQFYRRAFVQHAAPFDFLLGKVFKARGLGNCLVQNALQLAVAGGTNGQALNAARAVAEGKHLLAF